MNPPYSTVSDAQYCWTGTVQYSTVQYSTVQYSTVLVQYSTVLGTLGGGGSPEVVSRLGQGVSSSCQGGRQAPGGAHRPCPRLFALLVIFSGHRSQSTPSPFMGLKSVL